VAGNLLSAERVTQLCTESGRVVAREGHPGQWIEVEYGDRQRVLSRLRAW